MREVERYCECPEPLQAIAQPIFWDCFTGEIACLACRCKVKNPDKTKRIPNITFEAEQYYRFRQTVGNWIGEKQFANYYKNCKRWYDFIYALVDDEKMSKEYIMNKQEENMQFAKAMLAFADHCESIGLDKNTIDSMSDSQLEYAFNKRTTKAFYGGKVSGWIFSLVGKLKGLKP